jgi:hypothetical protein
VEEGYSIMKKFLGIAVMGLLFLIPAHAQGRGGGGFGAGSGPNGFPTFGGGSTGGGPAGGESRANIQDYGRAQFATAAFSGGDASFAPSSFLTFEQAVEVGKLESAPQKSVAQVAAENLAAMKTKSRVEFVQDAVGRVVPLAR